MCQSHRTAMTSFTHPAVETFCNALWNLYLSSFLSFRFSAACVLALPAPREQTVVEEEEEGMLRAYNASLFCTFTEDLSLTLMHITSPTINVPDSHH